LEIRAEFDKHKNETDPQLVKKYLATAEAKLAAIMHPDPYISAKFPGGTGWERNLPPPPNAFIRYDDHHHTEITPETNAIEEVDILPPEDRARIGAGSKLSPRALSALHELVQHAQANKVFVNMVSGEPKAGESSTWKKAIAELQKRGMDTSVLESDLAGKKFSEYTEAEKEALVKDFDGPFWESLELRSRGIIEQEISDKRDREDGVYR